MNVHNKKKEIRIIDFQFGSFFLLNYMADSLMFESENANARMILIAFSKFCILYILLGYLWDNPSFLVNFFFYYYSFASIFDWNCP